MRLGGQAPLDEHDQQPGDGVAARGVRLVLDGERVGEARVGLRLDELALQVPGLGAQDGRPDEVVARPATPRAGEDRLGARPDRLEVVDRDQHHRRRQDHPGVRRVLAQRRGQRLVGEVDGARVRVGLQRLEGGGREQGGATAAGEAPGAPQRARELGGRGAARGVPAGEPHGRGGELGGQVAAVVESGPGLVEHGQGALERQGDAQGVGELQGDQPAPVGVHGDGEGLLEQRHALAVGHPGGRGPELVQHRGPLRGRRGLGDGAAQVGHGGLGGALGERGTSRVPQPRDHGGIAERLGVQQVRGHELGPGAVGGQGVRRPAVAAVALGGFGAVGDGLREQGVRERQRAARVQQPRPDQASAPPGRRQPGRARSRPRRGAARRVRRAARRPAPPSRPRCRPRAAGAPRTSPPRRARARRPSRHPPGRRRRRPRRRPRAGRGPAAGCRRSTSWHAAVKDGSGDPGKRHRTSASIPSRLSGAGRRTVVVSASRRASTSGDAVCTAGGWAPSTIATPSSDTRRAR